MARKKALRVAMHGFLYVDLKFASQCSHTFVLAADLLVHTFVCHRVKPWISCFLMSLRVVSELHIPVLSPLVFVSLLWLH